MNEYRELKKGSIKIGVPPMIGSFLFPYIFAGFKQVYPTLDVVVAEEGSLAIRTMLEKDELDLGIVITSQLSDLLYSHPITKAEILLCVALQHPLAGETAAGFEQLKNEAFILFKEDTYHRRAVLQECKKYGFEPNVLLSSSQTDTIRGLVAQGVGISFLLDVIARKDTQIHCISLRDPLRVEIGLAWKKDRYLAKASQAFIEFLNTVIKN